jgi:hypothetical protein
VRKFLIFLSLWLGLTAGVFAAETLSLADGTSFSGDIVKFDDYDAMIHTTTDSYTNITWPQFSQDTLKQLAANPKYRSLAEPFILPTATERPPKPEIKTKYEQTVRLPEHPSILGGLFQSSLGLFILLVIYGANFYAAYEVAVVRGKPVPLVVGLSAVLPIIGPIIFLAQPIQSAPVEETAPEEAAPGAPGAPAPGGGPAAAHDEIQIVSASWQQPQEEKKPQPQVFSRGKFTLNKRFIETKFAGFIGEPKGDALKFSMEIKTLKATIPVECIKQVGAAEAILETPTGQVTVPFADILEFKLTPKPV